MNCNKPYEIKAYIDDCLTLNNKEKEDLKIALKSSNAEAIKSWEQRPESGVKLLCKLRRWQAEVIKNVINYFANGNSIILYGRAGRMESQIFCCAT